MHIKQTKLQHALKRTINVIVSHAHKTDKTCAQYMRRGPCNNLNAFDAGENLGDLFVRVVMSETTNNFAELNFADL